MGYRGLRVVTGGYRSYRGFEGMTGIRKDYWG